MVHVLTDQPLRLRIRGSCPFYSYAFFTNEHKQPKINQFTPSILENLHGQPFAAGRYGREPRSFSQEQRGSDTTELGPQAYTGQQAYVHRAGYRTLSLT